MLSFESSVIGRFDVMVDVEEDTLRTHRCVCGRVRGGSVGEKHVPHMHTRAAQLATGLKDIVQLHTVGLVPAWTRMQVCVCVRAYVWS